MQGRCASDSVANRNRLGGRRNPLASSLTLAALAVRRYCFVIGSCTSTSQPVLKAGSSARSVDDGFDRAPIGFAAGDGRVAVVAEEDAACRSATDLLFGEQVVDAGEQLGADPGGGAFGHGGVGRLVVEDQAAAGLAVDRSIRGGR